MKLKDKNTRKLLKIGKTSLAVTLPKEMTNKLNWREKQKVNIILKGRSIIVRDWLPAQRSSSKRKAWRRAK